MLNTIGTPLAIALAISLSQLGVPLSVATAIGCSRAVELAGQCSAQTNGNELRIVGEIPSHTGTSPQSGQHPDSNTGTAPPRQKPRQEPTFDECLASWNSGIDCFAVTQPSPDIESLRSVSITDLAAFAPAGVAAIGEPGNVGIAGMPTNFVAAASAHTRSGTLFGFPITVRFTPVGYDFDYGDGDGATTASGGKTWNQLGQAQFTPTSTSHVYQERGTYVADVDVRYTAEVDLGIGWLPVAGELTTDGPDQQIRIFEAHTALVAYTCAQRPSGPGC